MFSPAVLFAQENSSIRADHKTGLLPKDTLSEYELPWQNPEYYLNRPDTLRESMRWIEVDSSFWHSMRPRYTISLKNRARNDTLSSGDYPVFGIDLLPYFVIFDPQHPSRKQLDHYVRKRYYYYLGYIDELNAHLVERSTIVSQTLLIDSLSGMAYIFNGMYTDNSFDRVFLSPDTSSLLTVTNDYFQGIGSHLDVIEVERYDSGIGFSLRSERLFADWLVNDALWIDRQTFVLEVYSRSNPRNSMQFEGEPVYFLVKLDPPGH